MVVFRQGKGAALVTRDGGKTWKEATGLPDAFIPDAWNWSVPLASDGATSGVFYAAKDGVLYRSVDRGGTFAVAAKIANIRSSNLCAVPGRAGEIYLSAGEGGLYRSTDSGLTFRKLPSVRQSLLFAAGKPAPGATLPALYLYGSLTPERTDKTPPEGIYRSTDGGANWSLIQDRRRPIGDEPNCMTASWQTFGLVFIGANGRGVYYGQPRRVAGR